MEWAHQRGYSRVWNTRVNYERRINAQTCKRAAENGQLVALQWLRQNGCEWNSYTCSAAAEGGYLSVLQWARENGCDWNAFTFEAALGFGNLGLLNYLIDEGCPTW